MIGAARRETHRDGLTGEGPRPERGHAQGTRSSVSGWRCTASRQTSSPNPEPSSIRACDSAEPHLPSEPVQGLVVRDVERLTRDHQEQLVEWLNGPGFQTRIVATSGKSLYPMVERGEFSDALYYRINMITLLLDESAGFIARE